MSPSAKGSYSDPDVRALLRETGQTNPYAAVFEKVHKLLAKLNQFDTANVQPLQRILVLASLAGLEARPMDTSTAEQNTGDAILVPIEVNGSKGVILYNTCRPEARIIHTVAHEIVHSFFPTSTAGAHFRTNCRDGSAESRELEQFCDFGAAELTMPVAEFREIVQEIGFGMRYVDDVRARFGPPSKPRCIEWQVRHRSRPPPDRPATGLGRTNFGAPLEHLIAESIVGILFTTPARIRRS